MRAGIPRRSAGLDASLPPDTYLPPPDLIAAGVDTYRPPDTWMPPYDVAFAGDTASRPEVVEPLPDATADAPPGDGTVADE